MHEAEDEVLFKVLEMQSGIADQARKKGRLRPASASLDRALKEGKIRAKAGQPAGFLACASVRLQSCAMLSQFQKHSEALEEACAAVLEMDKLWKGLSMANGIAQAAVRDHRCVSDALKKVHPGLRQLMLKPPKWLDQAVAVSVEAKHCVALELEYCVLAQEPVNFMTSQLPMQGFAAAEARKACQAHSRPWSAPAIGKEAKAAEVKTGADDDLTWALSVASAGVGQLKDPWGLIERLHAEGSALAELLLPDGHPVLERSRRTESQACLRNPAIATRLAQEAQDAAAKAAEEARHRAAEEAERKAAQAAARRAAEEEAARRVAEETVREAAMWHPDTKLGEERSEQIVVQREKLEPRNAKPAPIHSEAIHEDALMMPEGAQKNESDRSVDASGSTSAKSGEPARFQNPNASTCTVTPLNIMAEDIPEPGPKEVAADFLRECFADSAAGLSFHRMQEIASREGMGEVSTAATQRPATAILPSVSMPTSAIPSGERPATAPVAVGERTDAVAWRTSPVSSTGQRLSRPASSPAFRERNRVPDMFKEWKAEQCLSYDQLSYVQKKLSSDVGVDDMKVYFKREAQRFVHGYLNDVTPEVLYENRVNFTPSMVAERKRQQERYGLGLDPEEAAPPETASTGQLQRAMRRTWASLYGFRDTDPQTNKRKTSKGMREGFKSVGGQLPDFQDDQKKRCHGTSRGAQLRGGQRARQHSAPARAAWH